MSLSELQNNLQDLATEVHQISITVEQLSGTTIKQRATGLSRPSSSAGTRSLVDQAFQTKVNTKFASIDNQISSVSGLIQQQLSTTAGAAIIGNAVNTALNNATGVSTLFYTQTQIDNKVTTINSSISSVQSTLQSSINLKVNSSDFNSLISTFINANNNQASKVLVLDSLNNIPSSYLSNYATTASLATTIAQGLMRNQHYRQT